MRAIVAILFLIVFHVSGPAIPARGEIVFSDDFNDGLDSLWLHASRWTAESGRLYYTGPSDPQRFLCGGSLESQLHFLSFDFCRHNVQDELGFMVMSPLAPFESNNTSGYTIFLSNDGYGYLATPGNILQDSYDSLLTMQTGVPYRVEFGYQENQIRYRHWPLGSDTPDWFWAHEYDGLFDRGFWYIFVNSTGTGSWIDNFTVEGSDTIPNEQMTWGAIKQLYD